MTEDERRLEALKLAMGNAKSSTTIEGVIEAAQKMADFLGQRTTGVHQKETILVQDPGTAGAKVADALRRTGRSVEPPRSRGSMG